MHKSQTADIALIRANKWAQEITGDSSMGNGTNTTRNNHYVPQFYLRLWATDHSTVWVRKKGAAEAKRERVKVVARSRDFYRQDYEDFLSNDVERPASGALRRLIATRAHGLKEKGGPGDRGDRFHIARFMFHQLVRTSQMRDALISSRFVTGVDEKLMSIKDSIKIADTFINMDQIACQPGGFIYEKARAELALCDLSEQGELVCTDNPVLMPYEELMMMPVGPRYWLSVGDTKSGTSDFNNAMLCMQASEVYAKSKATADAYFQFLPDQTIYSDKGLLHMKTVDNVKGLGSVRIANPVGYAIPKPSIMSLSPERRQINSLAIEHFSHIKDADERSIPDKPKPASPNAPDDA